MQMIAKETPLYSPQGLKHIQLMRLYLSLAGIPRGLAFGPRLFMPCMNVDHTRYVLETHKYASHSSLRWFHRYGTCRVCQTC